MTRKPKPQVIYTRKRLPESTARQREGSPWTGLWAVVGKEMADHLTGARMRFLELLIALLAIGTVYAAVSSGAVRSSSDEFLFLKLFSAARDPLPSFVSLMGFLIPIIAITMAFDAVNGEFNRRTLARLLAQPIYRDALLMGKFLAGLLTQAILYTTLWLLVLGLGILTLGIPPSGEEVARALWLLVAAVFYGGVWMALALTFSVVFRSPATAALAALATWLFFTVFWDIIAQSLAAFFAPIRYGTAQELINQARWLLGLERIAPSVLFAEIVVALLNPNVRTLGFVLPFQLDRAVLGQPLPLGQSVLLIWPHLTGLIAATLLLFALAYVLFQRQEVRA